VETRAERLALWDGKERRRVYSSKGSAARAQPDPNPAWERFYDDPKVIQKYLNNSGRMP
jgi:hypothetical protein